MLLSLSLSLSYSLFNEYLSYHTLPISSPFLILFLSTTTYPTYFSFLPFSQATSNGLGGVNAPFTVASAGLLLTGGVTVAVDGLYVGWSQWGQPTVTGGITVAAGGVYVGDGGSGMSMKSGTMMVTGGLTITSTTTSAGLKITGGLSINGG